MKAGIIWDFDDTLVETAVFFETARERFARLMVSLGFPLDEVLEKLNLLDIENVRLCGGFLKECFPRAMAQTYDYFCRVKGIVPNPAVRKSAEEIGWWVFDQRPEPVSGACDILDGLSFGGRYELILATKGDPEIQWQRIEDSGLKKYFKKVYVLKDKTKLEYELIARWHGFDPGCSWVVGNSIKSDINPGIMSGYNCIYIPNRYTWSYEMEEPLGKYITLETLNMVPELLLGGSIAV